MPWNGSGTFTRYNGVNTGADTWDLDRQAGTKIESGLHDTHDQDMADAINNCITKDNQSKPTASLKPNATGLDLGSVALPWRNVHLSGDANIAGDADIEGNCEVTGNNTVTGNATIGGTMTVSGVVKFAKGADVASANDLDLASDGNYNDVTGTTTVNGMTSGVPGEIRKMHYDGILTLKHDTAPSSGYDKLYLLGGVDITTEANDEAEYISDGTYWRCVNYSRASGAPAVIPSGTVRQVVNVQDGAVATGSTVMPIDDTIPQITEGVEFMTLAITPTSATNKLKIDIVCNLAHSSALGLLAAALFQGSTADALAVGIDGRNGAADNSASVSFTHYMTAGTTSSTTFRVRAGCSLAGTTTFNGSGAARLFGGVMASSITITEIQV
jgi:hypothetical protein